MLGQRIAVCFSGQLRTGVETAPVLREFIGEVWNSCDFFIHTWDRNSSKNRGPRFFSDTISVPEQRFQQIAAIYNPISMQVDNLADTQQLVYQQTGVTPAGQLPMFRSIYRANQLKTQYEQLCQSQYRHVVRLRFDQVFDRAATLNAELQYYANAGNSAYLNTCDYGNKLPTACEDCAWISSSATMDIACDFLSVREQLNCRVQTDWQTHLSSYLSEQGISAHHWRNNNLFIYRDYHLAAGISPQDTELLV